MAVKAARAAKVARAAKAARVTRAAKAARAAGPILDLRFPTREKKKEGRLKKSQWKLTQETLGP